MRWEYKQRQSHQVGDRRIVRRFLWWPARVGDEVWWLERVTVEQQAQPVTYIGEGGGGERVGWVDVAYIVPQLPASGSDSSSRIPVA
jgi:hypothetical protein